MATPVNPSRHSSTSKPHNTRPPWALFIPFPVYGQINPMMHLAETLVKNHGPTHDQQLHITFISNHYQHTRLATRARPAIRNGARPSSTEEAAGPPGILSTNSTLEGNHEETVEELDQLGQRGFSEEIMVQPNIGSVSVDNGLPPELDLYKDLDETKESRLLFVKSCQAMGESIKLFIQHHHLQIDKEEEKAGNNITGINQHARAGRVSLVVVGVFCDWAISAVVDLGIPIVHFSTQAATVFSLYLHTPRLIAHGFFHQDTKFKEEQGAGSAPSDHDHGKDERHVTYIPGVPPLLPSSFPTYMHEHDPASFRIQFLETQSRCVMLCNAIIINTFEELEEEACRALESESGLPVYPIGPVLPLQIKARATVPMQPEDGGGGGGCIAWLNKRPRRSVLYISFGSLWNPTAELVKRIAEGIKASKRPFVWALRPSSCWASEDVREVLPERFMEETDGLVVPWAPQLDVLAHPSTGAFLTHCGWNSVLESMSMGVLMIPIPFVGDQVTNCRLVVDIWKVGMSVKFVLDSVRGPMVESSEIERVVKSAFEEGQWAAETRTNARALADVIERATQCGGSSHTHLQKFKQEYIVGV